MLAAGGPGWADKRNQDLGAAMIPTAPADVPRRDGRLAIRLICALFGCVVTGVSALDIGDTAPPLEGVTWLKGQAPDFSSGLTVVEFWATWCGPCKNTIPHLSELQAKYAGKVAIVGLSKEDLATMKPYVDGWVDGMAYIVGKAPEALSDLYMDGVPGIPHAFLVDSQGKVAWHGHPITIGPILEQAVNGTLDVERQRKVGILEKALQLSLKTKDFEQIAQAADALLMFVPTHQQGMYLRGMVAKAQKDVQGYRSIYSRLEVDSLSAQDANSFAWSLAVDAQLEYRNIDLAFKLATYAIQKDPSQSAYFDTFARVLYCLGNLDEAIVWQTKASELDPSSASVKAVLNYYTQAKTIRDRLAAAAMVK